MYRQNNFHKHTFIYSLCVCLYEILLHWQPHTLIYNTQIGISSFETILFWYIFYICLNVSYLISCRVRECLFVRMCVCTNISKSKRFNGSSQWSHVYLTSVAINFTPSAKQYIHLFTPAYTHSFEHVITFNGSWWYN